MRQSWDVGVVGLGAMGSAAVCELARRGLRVVGFDRYEPPHVMGSSHGATRIIREAYFEHPQYVPLVRRSYERWAALERETATTLFRRTGGLMIGPPDGILVCGARASADLHGLPYELLDAHQLLDEYPAFARVESFVAVREPRAGALFPERCVQAHLAVAVKHGAVLRIGVPVDAWRPTAEAIEIVGGGERFLCDRLVLAPGAWMSALAPGVDLPLTVSRQVQHWFAPRTHPDHFSPDRFPVFLLEHEPDTMIYGFAAIDETGPGVKVARHHHGGLVQVETVDRRVHQHEVDDMSRLLDRFLPDLAGAWLRSEVCLYTNTPDFDFLVDWHPAHGNVLLVSACSGHGFKFSSALGEVIADLLTKGRSDFDLSPFRFGRWLRADSSSADSRDS
jgi:sarcosine oxidase